MIDIIVLGGFQPRQRPAMQRVSVQRWPGGGFLRLTPPIDNI